MKRVIVCMKPVPDPKAWDRLKMDPVTKTLIRQGIPSVVNPLDKHAVEAALEVKDLFGAEVVLLSMAPLDTCPVLREVLAMGADRAVLLSDTLATARILTQGIRNIGDFDLVMCGNFTLDGSTAQVPSQVAELLDVPNVMHVCDMDISNTNRLLLTQKIEQGFVKLEAEPPLLLSFTKEANKPRYISFMEILAAEKRDIHIWDNAFLNMDENLIGLEGSPTQMADLLLQTKKRKGIQITGKPEDIARELADKIHQLGMI
jgi:electron transfer flavoprotein beta subunit